MSADLASVLVANLSPLEIGYLAAELERRGVLRHYAGPYMNRRRKLCAEEAERQPRFAAALPGLDQLPHEYAQRIEAECALTDRILVGSKFVRESFVAIGHDASNAVIAPYGVDTQRFSPRRVPRKDGVFRVLFVGQIGKRTGISYLFQAYRQFRRPKSELHVVGSYVAGTDVYGSYANLYRHRPNVPQQYLPASLREADVFVLPSLIEGMPLLVLEAMACGLPVITPCHGAGDVVRTGVDGLLLPIRESEAIEQRHRDPTLRELLSTNARERASAYSWNAYAQGAADSVLDDKRQKRCGLNAH